MTVFYSEHDPDQDPDRTLVAHNVLTWRVEASADARREGGGGAAAGPSTCRLTAGGAGNSAGVCAVDGDGEGDGDRVNITGGDGGGGGGGGLGGGGGGGGGGGEGGGGLGAGGGGLGDGAASGTRERSSGSRKVAQATFMKAAWSGVNCVRQLSSV